MSDFSRLEGLGVKNILSLQGNLVEIYRNDIEDDCDDFIGRVYFVPLGSVVPPSRQQVAKCLAFIKSCVGPVYIHCEQGVDRTGFIVASYRMVLCGESWSFAVGEMFRSGFHKLQYWWWTFALLRYA